LTEHIDFYEIWFEHRVTGGHQVLELHNNKGMTIILYNLNIL